MSIVDIFSKRQRRLRGELPDVYQYTDLPTTFRRQVIHILRDIIGNGQQYSEASEYYQAIHDILAREFGVFTLHEYSTNPQDTVFNFLLTTTRVDDALSAIEVAFNVARIAQQDVHIYYTDSLVMTVTDAIEELNARFLEHGIGYQFESREIVRIDSEFIHQEAVRPALQVLSGKHYAGANEEFRKAHDHYRHQRYGEAVNECLKAVESTLKVICEKRRWPFHQTDTVQRLIQIVFDHELIPSYLQSQFSGLRSILESGVPTIRNREGSHGAGAVPRSLPRHLAAYVLHLTASAIVFLSQCDEIA